MSYSKSYQTVIAGRVREDEGIAFFGQNKIATPARVTSFTNLGGKAQPKIEEDFLAVAEVGKPGVRQTGKSDIRRNISAYNENKVQNS